jgi:hypothetical protein
MHAETSWSTSTTWTRWASCATEGTPRCSNGRWPGTGPGVDSPSDLGQPRFRRGALAVRQSAITYHLRITQVRTVRVRSWRDRRGTTRLTYGFQVLSDGGRWDTPPPSRREGARLDRVRLTETFTDAVFGERRRRVYARSEPAPTRSALSICRPAVSSMC